MSSASFLSSKQSSHPWCYCTIHAASFRDMHFAFHLISSVFEGISVLKIFWTEMISLFSILFKLVGLFLLTSKDLHTLQFKISKYIKYLDYISSPAHFRVTFLGFKPCLGFAPHAQHKGYRMRGA